MPGQIKTDEIAEIGETEPSNIEITLRTDRGIPIEVSAKAVIKDGEVVRVEDDIFGEHMRLSEDWQTILEPLKKAGVHGWITEWTTDDQMDFPGEYKIIAYTLNRAIEENKIKIKEHHDQSGTFEIEFLKEE